MKSPAPSSYCRHILRYHDFDRYIASLFAPKAKRAGLVAIWAFQCEMARLAAKVNQPLMGEIRLRWWCDEIEEIEVSAEKNPLLKALSHAIYYFNLPKQSFITACEAHMRLLYDVNMEAKEFALYCDETSGIFFQLACQIVEPEQATRATAACYHAGQFEGLWNKQEINPYLREHYHAFIYELTKLPRSVRPAFLSLIPKAATLSRENTAPLSPLRRLWLISRASLLGY